MQSEVPGGQTQLPPLQTVPAVQRLSQPPQFSGSLLVSVQVTPQVVLPAGQEVTHSLSEQSSVILHLPPQLPAQAVPLSQTHFPDEQCVPGPQATPQPPQLSLSACRSAQVPP